SSRIARPTGPSGAPTSWRWSRASAWRRSSATVTGSRWAAARVAPAAPGRVPDPSADAHGRGQQPRPWLGAGGPLMEPAGCRYMDVEPPVRIVVRTGGAIWGGRRDARAGARLAAWLPTHPGRR